MKRLLYGFLPRIFFAVFLLVTLLLTAAQAEKITANYYADGKKQSSDVEVQVNDKYLYGYLPDNSIVILMYYGKNKSVDIQKDFGDAIVTSINANAFNVFADPYVIDDKYYQVDHGLEHVIVPSTVTYLGEYWFHVHKWSNTVTYNNLPDGLKYADQNALNHLKIDSIPLWNDIYIAENNLNYISVPSKTLTISDDYISIPRGWFGHISANKVVLPKNLEKIDMSCLNTNDGATELILPDHLQEIGSSSFRRWTKLKKIWIPASLKSIGDECFSDAPIEEVVFQEGIVKIDFSFLRHVNTLKKISLPSTLKVIESRCFLATGLSNLELPFGTETIKEAAFKDCNKLVTVRLPGSLTSIADDAFEGCSEKCIFTVDINSYAEKWANEKGYKTKVIIPVTDISLDINTVILNKGKSQTLKAAIAPDNSTNKKVEWISSDPAIATVNNGNIKAVACGKCDITCRAIDGSGVQAVCHVSVIQMIQNIQAKDKKITIPFGGTYQSEITIKPDDATNRILSWTSSEESICQVNDNGLITAVGAGDCEIICASTDGSNKNLVFSVHVPIFSDTSKEITVTNKDGITIPFDTHGLSLYYIQHKATTDKYFLYSLDKSGLHIYPIAEGSAKITLSNKLAPKDQMVYNVTIDKEAVFDNSNGDSEPLSIIIVPDKSVVRVGDKVTFTYFVKGNVADVSYQGIRATGSNGYGGSGGSYQKTQKGKNAGTLTINTKNYATWQRIGFSVTAVDGNGNTTKKECFAWVEDALGITAIPDTLVAKVGVPVNIYIKCSGGIPPYSVDISTTVAGKQTRYTQNNIKQDYSFSVDPGAFPDVTMECHLTIKDSKGSRGFAPSLLIDVKNEEPISCNPQNLIFMNEGKYYIEINEGMNKPDISLQAYYGCEDKEEYICFTGEYIEPINVRDNLWEFTLDRNPLGIDIIPSSGSSAQFASVLFNDIQEIE